MEDESRSLLNEIQFLILLVSAAIVIGVAGVSLFILSNSIQADLQARSVAASDELVSLLEYPLYVVDDEQAVRIAHAFLSSGKISGIVLESTAGGVLLSQTPADDSRRVPRISRDISREGVLLGKVTLTFSDEEIVRAQGRLMKFSIAVILAVLGVNLLSNRLFIVRRIKRPFNVIISAIRNISAGNYETPADATAYREVNILVSHFNDMAATIHRKNQAQKISEDALKESERKARAILDLSFGFIGLLTPDGILIEANRSALDFAGVSLSEVAGKPFWETVWWAHSPEMKERLREAVRTAGGGELVRFEATHVGKDGLLHDMDVSIKPVMDESGAVILLIPEGRDITERKRAEESLSQSENRFRSIIQGSADIILVMDANGIVTYESPSTAQILGISSGYLLNRSPLDLVHPEDAGRIERDLQEVFLGVNPGKPSYFRGRHTDGSWLYLEAVGSNQLQNPAVRGVVITARDITARKKAEEEKLTLQTQLLQAQKMESIGRLAGGVAHDFNNMLSAILGHAQLAILDHAPSDPIFNTLKLIEKAALRSSDIIRQLLAFARKQTVVPKVLDLNESMTGMLQMLMRLIGEGIDLAWMPGPNLWPIRVDPTQVDQILVNLCVNARDATGGKGKISIETENTCFDEVYCAAHSGFFCGAYVMLAVSDNGCGMEKEVLENIFEPFFTTKEVGKGTGLGLATVYGIVKQNEGFINVTSEPGKGTTFKIYLPRFEGAVAGLTAPVIAPMPEGHGETILLVDDEAMVLEVGSAMLEKLGYRVLSAGSPGEAIGIAGADTEIRLLITDVVMPGMNGRELAARLSEVCPDLKCIFSSGYTANVIAHHGVLDEGVHFIQKPFSIQHLAAILRDVLAS